MIESQPILRVGWYGITGEIVVTPRFAGAEEAEMEDEKVREALAEMFELVESGELVRDVSRDAQSDWHIRMMKLTLTLKKAQEALAAPPVEAPRLVMGDGDYSCAVCGMGMREPCEHWKKFLEQAPVEAPKTAPASERELRELVWRIRNDELYASEVADELERILSREEQPPLGHEHTDACFSTRVTEGGEKREWLSCGKVATLMRALQPVLTAERVRQAVLDVNKNGLMAPDETYYGTLAKALNAALASGGSGRAPKEPMP